MKKYNEKNGNSDENLNKFEFLKHKWNLLSGQLRALLQALINHFE